MFYTTSYELQCQEAVAVINMMVISKCFHVQSILFSTGMRSYCKRWSLCRHTTRDCTRTRARTQANTQTHVRKERERERTPAYERSELDTTEWVPLCAVVILFIFILFFHFTSDHFTSLRLTSNHFKYTKERTFILHFWFIYEECWK